MNYIIAPSKGWQCYLRFLSIFPVCVDVRALPPFIFVSATFALPAAPTRSIPQYTHKRLYREP